MYSKLQPYPWYQQTTSRKSQLKINRENNREKRERERETKKRAFLKEAHEKFICIPDWDTNWDGKPRVRRPSLTPTMYISELQISSYGGSQIRM